MKRVSVFVPLSREADDAERQAIERALHRHGLGKQAKWRVVRRSLDARKGRDIGFHVELEVEAPPVTRVELPQLARLTKPRTVAIVGAGPCGTFAALRLIEAGVKVVLIDQGKTVQPRRHDLARLNQRGELSPRSNYCFGEGGAGTFSDGKLYTRVKDRLRIAYTLQTLIDHGAEAEIAVEQRPHIGSNRLPKIVTALRETLERAGVEYWWEESVDKLIVANGRVTGVGCESGRTCSTDAVVLAPGHSARPLFEHLADLEVALVAKPFAVGVRIEHRQEFVDRCQYGRSAGHPALPPAFYQLTATVPHSAGSRGVFSFCMCPGGWIIDSSTEPDALCTNGMSLSRRDSPFANAAFVVNVEPEDLTQLPGREALRGLAFQRQIERDAFVAGGAGFIAPAQQLKDFLQNRDSDSLLATTYLPGILPANLSKVLPPFVVASLQAGLTSFERKMPGFAHGAQLVGVETRTSSPVRILRDEKLQSPSHPGLFPAGEGAGYAGGIMSAAVDGLRVADAVLQNFAG